MKKFLLNLQFLFMPHYWLMANEYSKDVDELINSLLDKYEFTDFDGFTAKLGKASIWVENIPYAAMCLYDTKYREINELRPSRLTIKRGLKKFRRCKREFRLKSVREMKEKIAQAAVNYGVG